MTVSFEIDHFAAEAAGKWNLSVRQIRRDLQIAGSPDRCELRLVLECDCNQAVRAGKPV